MLDKKAFFEFNDAVIEKVDVPEWGDFNKEIYIRNMSGTARSIFEISIVDTKDAKEQDHSYLHNIRSKLIVLSCCDKDGKLHFDDSDLEEVGKKSAGALESIFEAAMELNKISAKDVDEMEKTLEDNQS